MFTWIKTACFKCFATWASLSFYEYTISYISFRKRSKLRPHWHHRTTDTSWKHSRIPLAVPMYVLVTWNLSSTGGPESTSPQANIDGVLQLLLVIDVDNKQYDDEGRHSMWRSGCHVLWSIGCVVWWCAGVSSVSYFLRCICLSPFQGHWSIINCVCRKPFLRLKIIFSSGTSGSENDTEMKLVEHALILSHLHHVQDIICCCSVHELSE